LEFINEKKAYISFAGGGLRSAAHIGALKYFEEINLSYGGVAGSSAGAIVAACVAAGKTSDEIFGFIKSVEKKHVFSFSFSKGLFHLDKFRDHFQEFIGITEFSELLMPCYVCVTNINTGDPVYLSKGNLIDAVIASCSLTPTFVPYEIDGVFYNDGGFSDNMPVQPFDGQYPVIGININFVKGTTPKSFKSLLIRSIILILSSNTRYSREKADLVIDVEFSKKMHLFQFSEVISGYHSGYNSTKKTFLKE